MSPCGAGEGTIGSSVLAWRFVVLLIPGVAAAGGALDVLQMGEAQATLDQIAHRLAKQHSPQQTRGLRRAAEYGERWESSKYHATDDGVEEAVGVVDGDVA